MEHGEKEQEVKPLPHAPCSTPHAKSKLKTFLEMIKFEHSIFALPFAYLGLLLAEEGLPRLSTFLGVTVAMVSFRTLGMALNRLIDVPVDAANPRTKNRALPAGQLKASFVWAAALVSFLIFEASAYFLGSLCFKLSAVPVFLAGLYPYMKRFTWFSHFLLGIILGIAPYGAWLAARGEFSWIPGLLMLGVVTWVAGFDIIYALQDVDFDRKTGLYSVPARFGETPALFITQALHAVTVLAWFFAGRLAGLGWIYQAGIVLAALFLIWEHRLIHSQGLKKIEQAFFTMNAGVSISVFAAAVTDLLLKG
jgi:4-hydroxybenzoate polyprenyltransferase